MNDRETVDNLIRSKNLTPEELELHRDLIETCRERERQIEACAQETRRNLEKLSHSLTQISERTMSLSSALSRLLDEAETLYLRTLPEEKFYRE